MPYSKKKVRKTNKEVRKTNRRVKTLNKSLEKSGSSVRMKKMEKIVKIQKPKKIATKKK